MITAKKSVETLKAYVAPLEGRRGKLRLDFNENTLGPSPKVLEAIQALPPEAYATYPEYDGLNKRFAEELSVPVQNVAAFNGVDGAIRAIFDAYGAAGETFLTTAPTFGYYGPCAAQQDMGIQAINYLDDLSYPLDDIRRALKASPRLLFICNPNNPTGTLLPAAQILELARQAPNTLVVVDELYVDFTGESVVPDGLALDNLVVLRSLSKSRGIAALRMGFAVGPASVLDRMSRVTGPYDINMFAVVAGRAALDDRQHMLDYVAEVAEAKKHTAAELVRMGLRVQGDGGNYLLVWPPTDNAKLVSDLGDRGILVRNMDGKPLIDGSFRLTIGVRHQMKRFVAELASLLPD